MLTSVGKTASAATVTPESASSSAPHRPAASTRNERQSPAANRQTSIPNPIRPPSSTAAVTPSASSETSSRKGL